MLYLRQPEGSSLCGQACVAMVANINLQQAVDLVGHTHGTVAKELVYALRAVGVQCADRLKRLSKKWPTLPRRAIIACRHPKRRYGHWIVIWDGQFFDPDGDAYKAPGWEMTSYLEISS